MAVNIRKDLKKFLPYLVKAKVGGINVPSTRSRLVLSAIVCALLITAASAAAQSYTVLHPFETPLQYPRGLVQASDGNFYGTTGAGGASGNGSVFKITPAGTLTTLYSFAGSDGANPYAGLVQGTDGNFYGTTTSGGPSDYRYGTVFKITPAGALTTLYFFAGSDGAWPDAGLVQGTDGNFYGTTYQGGTFNNGTVFKITPAGTLTTLHSFAYSWSDGAYPVTGLVQGTDGNFYGTTSRGTIFKITPAGALTGLYNFSGGPPVAGLVQGTDGNFYGTTTYGGTSDYGTVFKITPAGALTTLHSFAFSDGAYPLAGLVQGTDGNLYGTTYQGGTSNYGTVFKITPAGALTTLYSFTYSDGAYPATGLVQGTDGNFYGTTYQGGTSGGGVVFRLTRPSPTVTGVSPASGPVSGGTVVTVSGTEFQPGATVRFGSTVLTGITNVSATTIYALTPVHAAGAVTVTVTNPDLQAGSLASAYTYTCSWTPTALNGGPYCVGATIALSTPTVSGATYSWTGPNGSTSTLQNPTIPAATTAATGTYSVTVTVAGCTSAPGTTNVTVNPAPATPAVTAPSAVGAGSPNRAASVASHAGSTYVWTIQNGTITAGQGTNQITFTAGTSGTPLTLSVTETILGCTSAPGNAAVTVLSAGSGLPYYTVLPCRILDTRAGSGLPLPAGYGPPSMAGNGTQRTFVIAGQCGIPAGAGAVLINAAVWLPTTQGDLRVFPAGVATPLVSTLDWEPNILALANLAIVQLGAGGAITVQVDGLGTVDIFFDVNGYFQ